MARLQPGSNPSVNPSMPPVRRPNWSAEQEARQRRRSTTRPSGVLPTNNNLFPKDEKGLSWNFFFDTKNSVLNLGVGQNVVEDVSYIVDKSGNILINPQGGNPFTVNDYVDFWSNQNGYKQTVSQTRDLLAAKGYMTREAYAYSAKNGNMPDAYFKESLSYFVRDVSHVNYTRRQSNQKSFLTIDDAFKVMPTRSTTEGTGTGGRYVSISRQIFNKDDYRLAVDEAFRDVTGMGADEETLSNFVKVLQRLENKNPQKTVTIQRGKKSTSTTSGGLSPEAAKQKLKETALAAPGAEQYQKATTFMGYLMNAIKATGQ